MSCDSSCDSILQKASRDPERQATSFVELASRFTVYTNSVRKRRDSLERHVSFIALLHNSASSPLLWYAFRYLASSLDAFQADLWAQSVDLPGCLPSIVNCCKRLQK